ncbi:hypothetical protein D3C87_2067140 [compost metagenome]
MNPNAAGTINNVNNVELTKPPMIAIPIEVLIADASFKPIAIGIIPEINASDVIRIGRKRVRQAFNKATFRSIPS